MDPHNGTRHGNPVTSTDLHPKLNAFLDDIRDAGMTVTKKFNAMWHTGIQYAWGAQLKGWKLKEDWQYVVVNRIYPLMFQTIAKLAGNNPKIMTQAWDDEADGTTEFAEKWAGHLQYLWESPYELNMRLKLIKGLLDCAVFGYMVGYTYWDDKPHGGWNNKQSKWVGKVKKRFIHPALFWCDPSAETIEESENCGMKRRVKLEWAQNRWPKYKKELAAEAYTSKDAKFTQSDLISYKNQSGASMEISRQNKFSQIVSLILNQGTVTGENAEATGGDLQKYVDIEQIYWRDYSEEDIKIKDNVPADVLVQQGVLIEEEITGIYLDTQTGKPLEEWPTQVVNEYKRPKFPNGRFAVRIGVTILNPEEKDQVYKESRWPFTIMPYHILPHMWQGGNAIELARNNNDILNITVSSMVQQVRRTADPSKVVEAGSLALDRKGKVRTKFGDIFGLGKIIVAGKGKVDKMRDWIHPPLDPSVMLLAEAMKKDIDAQEFMHPVARGEKEKGKQTKAEVLTLNQNSLDYVGLQGVFLDKFIDDDMTLTAELCQRNYEPERLMKMLSDDIKSGIKADQQLLDVRFDVNIEPGSTLPFDEQKKQQEYGAAYQLLENPIPNPMIEDMLRVLNIAKRKEILIKYQGLQLFRQFIQMGQMLTEAQQEPEVLEIMQQMAQLPGMEQLIQLLLQAGQLAPQIKGA